MCDFGWGYDFFIRNKRVSWRFVGFRVIALFSCSPVFVLKAVRSEVRNCGKLVYFATMTGSFVKKALIKRLLFRVMEFQLCPHLDMIGLRKFSRADGWFFQFASFDKHEKGIRRLVDFCFKNSKTKQNTINKRKIAPKKICCLDVLGFLKILQAFRKLVGSSSLQKPNTQNGETRGIVAHLWGWRCPVPTEQNHRGFGIPSAGTLRGTWFYWKLWISQALVVCDPHLVTRLWPEKITGAMTHENSWVETPSIFSKKEIHFQMVWVFRLLCWIESGNDTPWKSMGDLYQRIL